jgi:hypothetical protein
VTDQHNSQSELPNKPSLLEFVRKYYAPGCPLCALGHKTRLGKTTTIQSYFTPEQKPDDTVRAPYAAMQELMEADFSGIERRMKEYWGQRFPMHGNPFSSHNLPSPTFREPGTLRPFRETGVRHRMLSNPGVYQPPHCRRKLSPCAKRKRARLKDEWYKRHFTSTKLFKYCDWQTLDDAARRARAHYADAVAGAMAAMSQPVRLADDIEGLSSAIVDDAAFAATMSGKPVQIGDRPWARIDEAMKRWAARRPCPSQEGSQQPQGGEENVGTEPQGE